MSKLRWFTDTEYESLADVLGVIKKELEALQPQDSADVRWDRGNDGMSASLVTQMVGSEQQNNVEVEPEPEPTTEVQSSAYNSYFKLVLVTEQNGENTQYKVAVVDGATYDPTTHSSGEMPCKVNNMSFSVAPFITEDAIQDYTLFLVKFTAPAEDDENAEGHVDVITDRTTLPSDSNTECFFQIGRAIVQDGAVQIAQDWTGGVPQIFWFTSC